MKKIVTEDRKKIRGLINEFENFDASQHQERLGQRESDEGKYKQEDVIFNELNTFLEYFNEWTQFEITVNQVLEKIKIQHDIHLTKLNNKPESNDPNQAEIRP